MELIDKQVTIDWLKKVTVTEGITFEAGFKQIIYDIEQMPCVEVRPEKEMTIGVAIAHLEDLQRMYLGNEKFKADVKALDVAIKALYEKSCKDCIIEGTEACMYGCEKRNIDDEVCENFIREVDV